MEGLGPWAVMRGATFDCGLAVVAEAPALPVVDVLPAASLLGVELQPATPPAIATIAIAGPLLLAAVRFLQLAPVDRSFPWDECRRFPDPCFRFAVAAHLTHVNAKRGLGSRVQLVQRRRGTP